MACHAPFHPDGLYAEVTRAAPYAALARQDFDDVLRFVADGGYALSGYERFRKLFQDAEGLVHVRGPQVARQLRMNLGTIVETPLMKVRLRGGPVLGEVEEWFVSTLEPGHTFIFGGQCCATRRSMSVPSSSAAAARASRACPPMPAAGCRSPPTSPAGCAASWPIRASGGPCPRPCGTG
ncbi:hypothetical protein [Teichococcus aestuarii]